MKPTTCVPGLGGRAWPHLHDFVDQGGLLITATDTTSFAVQFGFAPGISTGQGQLLKVTGSVLRSKLVDPASPIAYGYADNLALFASNPPILNLSNTAGGGRGGGGRSGEGDERERPTGRGTADDFDAPQGRAPAEIPEEPRGETWEAAPLTDEQLRNGVNVIPPAQRPRVVPRYAMRMSCSSLACSTTEASSPSTPRSSTRRWAGATCSYFQTIGSGAPKPREVISWCSTRF
jgi:hypothetical protein